MPDTARFADAPKRGDVIFPDSIVKIVFDFEINAFCAAGTGQGQYLGRCVWHWERTKGDSVKPLGNVTFAQGTLDQPTKQFTDAVDSLYAKRTRFVFPKIILPEKGGGPCQ